MDIIVTFFITSGIAAAILTYILQAKTRKKEKAEEAFDLILKWSNLLQSAIRATKQYNAGVISGEQYVKEAERFQNAVNAVSSGTNRSLGAIISLHFSALIPMLQQLAECYDQFSQITSKHEIGNNLKLSDELQRLSEKIESTASDLIVAIVKEGYR